MDNLDNPNFSSDGSPRDIAWGNQSHVWEMIEDMRKEQIKQGEAIARIEGRLSEQKDQKSKSSNWHVMIISAIVGGISGSLGLVLKSH